MAIKKPIVLTNGQLERLQPGDRIDVGNSSNKNNNSGGAIVIGQPVYVNGVNVDLAQADAQSTIRVAGLVVDITVADASPAEIVVDGILTATTGQWDAVTGQVGGLTPGADYFLSAGTAGQMSTTAPSANGEFVVRVGHALSTTEFEIEIQQPIKL